MTNKEIKLRRKHLKELGKMLDVIEDKNNLNGMLKSKANHFADSCKLIEEEKQKLSVKLQEKNSSNNAKMKILHNYLNGTLKKTKAEVNEIIEKIEREELKREINARCTTGLHLTGFSCR